VFDFFFFYSWDQQFAVEKTHDIPNPALGKLDPALGKLDPAIMPIRGLKKKRRERISRFL